MEAGGWRQADPVRAHRPTSQKPSFLFSKRPCHKAVTGRAMKKTPECGPLHVLAGAHICAHSHTCTMYANIYLPHTHTLAKRKQRGMFIYLCNIRMYYKLCLVDWPRFVSGPTSLVLW